MAYAAIGISTDGITPEVWGIGSSARTALHDARSSLEASGQNFIVVKIASTRLTRINNGDFSATDLVQCDKQGKLRRLARKKTAHRTTGKHKT